MFRTGTPRASRRARRAIHRGCDDIASTRERAAGDALTYFRDVFDVEEATLPGPLDATVKRDYEAGVAPLERLRTPQARLP